MMPVKAETCTAPEKKRSALRTLLHRLAVALEFLRRPGRFSMIHYPRNEALERLRQNRKMKVLDLGCGSRHLSDHVVGVDLVPERGVQVLADAAYLPFRDASCGGVWADALLEHVEDPEKILLEVRRVLKSKGWFYCEVPFLQGEHLAPGDYRRWTRAGLLQLFKNWDLEWVTPSSGPFSALAYQSRVCLSIMTSFGSDKLYRLLFEALWGYFVWPLKWLDICFAGNGRSQSHAFGYAVMASKKGA